MADSPPPKKLNGIPTKVVLPAGAVLARVHSTSFKPDAFNPNATDSHWGGGRFDGTPLDPFPFLYAASTDPAAVAEVLLRDLPTNNTGARLLPAAATVDRRISWIEATVDLPVVSLRNGIDLAAIGQDTWLVHTEANDYGKTRRWASAIRQWAPDAVGIVWRSKREPNADVFVFFGDRCPAASLATKTTGTALAATDNFLDRGQGRQYLLSILEAYRVTMR